MNDHDTDESHKESSSIPRPTSLLVGPSSQLRAPSSLLSGALPRSLLMNNNNNSPSMNLMFPGSSSSAPTGPLLRPRRLWNVQDNSLKRIPTGYPPLNPRCTVFVGDAPPSIVAVRIAECLRKRSIGVEYDEEMVRFPLSCFRVTRVGELHPTILFWGESGSFIPTKYSQISVSLVSPVAIVHM